MTSRDRADGGISGYAYREVHMGLKTMTIEWKDADDVVAKVGEAFMIKVFKNSGAGTDVRFGLMGEGTAPNYQVEVDGQLRGLFRGSSHKEWTGDSKEFDAHRISKPFPYKELHDAFLRQYRKKYTPPTKP